MTYERFHFPDIETLDHQQVEDIIHAAQPYYPKYYAYHNWDHAVTTIHGIEVIADKLSNRGTKIARNALRIAAAWHDAGYAENHVVKGFATKEEYSAALLDEYLRDSSVEQLSRQVMNSAIKATWPIHPEYRTPHEIILHRADTANIGGPSEGFIDANVRLFHEARQRGHDVPWSQHVAMTDRFVRVAAAEHDHESLLQNVPIDDTTVDVYNVPFGNQALSNLELLHDFPEPRHT